MNQYFYHLYLDKTNKSDDAYIDRTRIKGSFRLLGRESHKGSNHNGNIWPMGAAWSLWLVTCPGHCRELESKSRVWLNHASDIWPLSYVEFQTNLHLPHNSMHCLSRRRLIIILHEFNASHTWLDREIQFRSLAAYINHDTMMLGDRSPPSIKPQMADSQWKLFSSNGIRWCSTNTLINSIQLDSFFDARYLLVRTNNTYYWTKVRISFQ